MRKYKMEILIILIFLAGLIAVLYPHVANYLYEKNSSKVITNYDDKIKQMKEEEISKEKEAVRVYNQRLFERKSLDEGCLPYSELLDIDETMAYLECPTINIKLPIYHGTDRETLEKGVGHLEKTSLPMGGESTHVALTAHTGLANAELFTNLDDMEIDDIFYLHVLDETLTYRVYDIEIVEPENNTSLKITKGEDRVTLITCTPYGINSHRLLVHAERFEDAQCSTLSEAYRWPVRKYLYLMLLALVILIVIFFVNTITKKKRKASAQGKSHCEGAHYAQKHSLKSKHFK